MDSGVLIYLPTNTLASCGILLSFFGVVASDVSNAGSVAKSRSMTDGGEEGGRASKREPQERGF